MNKIHIPDALLHQLYCQEHLHYQVIQNATKLPHPDEVLKLLYHKRTVRLSGYSSPSQHMPRTKKRMNSLKN